MSESSQRSEKSKIHFGERKAWHSRQGEKVKRSKETGWPSAFSLASEKVL